jgi:hypothetical protein
MEKHTSDNSDTAMEDCRHDKLEDKLLTDFLRHRLSRWCYPGPR